jgi:hypothetical protein
MVAPLYRADRRALGHGQSLDICPDILDPLVTAFFERDKSGIARKEAQPVI